MTIQEKADKLYNINSRSVNRYDAKLLKRPTDFNKRTKNWYHESDWSSSSPDPELPYKSKGIFAGHPEKTLPYLLPHKVEGLFAEHKKTGKKHLFVRKRDKLSIIKHRPVMSTWSNAKANRFKPLNNEIGEHFSTNPGRPTSSVVIPNVIKHLKKQGVKTHFVNNLKGIRNKLVNNSDYNTCSVL